MANGSRCSTAKFAVASDSVGACAHPHPSTIPRPRYRGPVALAVHAVDRVPRRRQQPSSGPCGFLCAASARIHARRNHTCGTREARLGPARLEPAVTEAQLRCSKIAAAAAIGPRYGRRAVCAAHSAWAGVRWLSQRSTSPSIRLSALLRSSGGTSRRKSPIDSFQRRRTAAGDSRPAGPAGTACKWPGSITR